MGGIISNATDAAKSVASHVAQATNGKKAGLAALVTGAALVVIAGIMASGLLGGGSAYYWAAGFSVGSIVPFSFAALRLCSNPDRVRSMGNGAAPLQG